MTDDAKESLALADKYVPGINLTEDERDLIVRALRLSARQQASVERITECLCDIQDRLGPGCDEEAIARALLAKYDIFEKVEG